jgi:hypothetical protein
VNSSKLTKPSVMNPCPQHHWANNGEEDRKHYVATRGDLLINNKIAFTFRTTLIAEVLFTQ